MAEAEDVITDAARHATVFVRALWRRRQHGREATSARGVRLADVVERIDLLIRAVLGVSYRIRAAQRPAPPSFLRRLWGESVPHRLLPVAATDGCTLWLPGTEETADPAEALARFRVQGLRQALRAHRGSARYARSGASLQDDLYLVLESHAADWELLALLPGMASSLAALRRDAQAMRPARRDSSSHGGLAESLLQEALAFPQKATIAGLALPATATQCWHAAAALSRTRDDEHRGRRSRYQALARDAWTGELLPPPPHLAPATLPANDPEATEGGASIRTARLSRRPQPRQSLKREDDSRQGAWMIQTTQPHEHVEDALGMQRPTDRDDSIAAEDFADSLSELPEARLVATPGRPKEIFVADDPTPGAARMHVTVNPAVAAQFAYPEWDYRCAGYRSPGAVVRLEAPPFGDTLWIDRTLERHGAVLRAIQRRFAMLRAQRLRVRRKLDGEEIDIDAYVESIADYRAGLPLDQALYQTLRSARRDLAIVLLVDASGSTDSWIAADKRVIDVEREALLLVCLALEGLAEPYSVLAFSGEGPGGVVVRPLKEFGVRYGRETAQAIAGLEPERYTRAGAALRHATSVLMREAAKHRLLFLLSDGKPNDVDVYGGRYGVEDMRQAVAEARLQGIAPFCLTIDRQAASYMPKVFGARQYALLTEPERLPTVLLDWMRRLLAR